VKQLLWVIVALIIAIIWGVWIVKEPAIDSSILATDRNPLLFRLILIAYGFVKIIKIQFPFPDLYKLAAPFGDSSPMGLAWSLSVTQKHTTSSPAPPNSWQVFYCSSDAPHS